MSELEDNDVECSECGFQCGIENCEKTKDGRPFCPRCHFVHGRVVLMKEQDE